MGRKGMLYTLLSVSWLVSGSIPAQETSWEGTPQQAFLRSPIVEKYQCVTCHTISDEGGTVGPILNLVGLRRPEDWLRRWLDDPNAVKPGTKMPKFPFEGDELAQTVAYLSRMHRRLSTEAILAGDESSVEKGRALFADYDCYACHRVGDDGRFVGPDLTWVGLRKPEAWERIWLADPPGFKPGTFMPDFHIPEAAVEHLAAYLHTLKGQDNEAGRQWEYRISFIINTSAVYRGEMVWKRLGCWSCHGENGKGGVTNPNAAAGHESVPGMKGVRDKYEKTALKEKITAGTRVAAKDPDALPLPYDCPAYPSTALNEQGLDDLYAYVVSLAPPSFDWSIRGAVAQRGEIASGSYQEVEVTNGGTLSGRVYFEGSFPEPERIRPSRDNDVCGLRIPGEGFVVDPETRGLKNAVVLIRGIERGKPFAASAQQIAQLECRYRPHVTVVRPGERMTIMNQDSLLHNVHAYRGDETVFNMAQPFRGQRTPQSLPEEGLVRIACDVHDWMEAWVLVLNNPYFAISDATGAFTLTDVPPGTYQLTLWHESLGTVSRKVTVEAGGSSELDFVVIDDG